MCSAGEPGVLEVLDRARDVHRLAEAGVGVDDRGQVGHPGDLLCACGDLGERGQPDVGQPEVGGQHRARDVDAVEALALDQPGGQRVERAGQLQQVARREPLAQVGAASAAGVVVA